MSRNWAQRLSSALFIGAPCFLALLAYDWAAVVVLGGTGSRIVPWDDLARNAVQDLGLATVYAALITHRVAGTVAGYPDRTRRITLMMLGLALAWYEVMCAWASRQAGTSDLGVSLVLLFVVPLVLAPSYVRWVKTKVSDP